MNDGLGPRTAADVAVLVSAPGWVALHVADISLWIQWLGGVAVILASCAAAFYHIKAARKL